MQSVFDYPQTTFISGCCESVVGGLYYNASVMFGNHDFFSKIKIQ